MNPQKICANPQCGRSFTPLHLTAKFCRIKCKTQATYALRKARDAQNELKHETNNSVYNPTNQQMLLAEIEVLQSDKPWPFRGATPVGWSPANKFVKVEDKGEGKFLLYFDIDAAEQEALGTSGAKVTVQPKFMSLNPKPFGT